MCLDTSFTGFSDFSLFLQNFQLIFFLLPLYLLNVLYPVCIQAAVSSFRTGVFCLLQDLEQVFPVLTLHFSYIRKDRQRRKYVVLDDCPEQCLQVGQAGGGGLGSQAVLLEDTEFFLAVQGPYSPSTSASAAL